MGMVKMIFSYFSLLIFWKIQDTIQVSIYNRWGSEVFTVSNYDNKDNVFTGLNKNGNELPSGVYFYEVQFESGRKSLSGYLNLRR